jgi:hypothetical protein
MKSVYLSHKFCQVHKQNLGGRGSDTRIYGTNNAALTFIRKYNPLPHHTTKFSVKYLGSVNIQFFFCTTSKVRESGGMAPLITNLITGCTQVDTFTSCT